MKTENEKLPKLVGTNFVRTFRDYLISLIRNEKLTIMDVKKRAFMEMNVKPNTTGNYLKEMLEMGIIFESEKDEILKVGE